MGSPRLSVICPAYNQASYIRRALDGFVRQRTSFSFEVIVHDDASTDGTAEIIREYAAQHPDLFRPVMEEENQYSRGVPFLQQKVFPLVRGEYVALCEGDDYWTDERKLQRQVEWLDAHPESGLCFHPVTVHYEDGSRPDETFPPRTWGNDNTHFTFRELLRRNFVQTNSAVYRWRLNKAGSELPEGIMPVDWYMHLLHADGGEIGFLPETMSVYRRNSGGIWWGDRAGNSFYLRNGIAHLLFYRAVRERFGYEDTARTLAMARQTAIAALRTGDMNVLRTLLETFPDECRRLGDFIAEEAGLLRASRQRCARMIRLIKRKKRHFRRLIAIFVVLLSCLAVLAVIF